MMPEMSRAEKELVLDAQGLVCPEPLRLAQLRMGAMDQGQVLRIIATDPAAHIDFEAWCLNRGHELLACETHRGGWDIRVRKKN